MSSLIQPKSSSAIAYSAYTIKRASRALSCAPFQLNLFLAMMANSVPLPLMAGKSGIEHNYTSKILSENTVDADLSWLIQVGLLRREVDGQGITDSFRLTPLGKKIVTEWEKVSGKIPTPTLWDRLSNFFARWLKISI